MVAVIYEMVSYRLPNIGNILRLWMPKPRIHHVIEIKLNLLIHYSGFLHCVYSEWLKSTISSRLWVELGFSICWDDSISTPDVDPVHHHMPEYSIRIEQTIEWPWFCLLPRTSCQYKTSEYLHRDFGYLSDVGGEWGRLMVCKGIRVYFYPKPFTHHDKTHIRIDFIQIEISLLIRTLFVIINHPTELIR